MTDNRIKYIAMSQYISELSFFLKTKTEIVYECSLHSFTILFSTDPLKKK